MDPTDHPAPDEEASPPPPSGTPPSTGGELPPAESSWPTAFGIIGIVLAGLGLFGGCCGVAMPLVWPHYVQWLEGIGTPEETLRMVRASAPPTAWSLFAGAVGLILAIMLLIASVRLLRRRARGVRLYRVWAWVQIPWAVVGFLAGAFIQLSTMRQMPQTAPGGGVGPVIGLAVGGCWTLVIGVGYPVFFLWWVAREPVRQEVDAWETGTQGVI